MKVGIASFLGLDQDELKRQYLLLDHLYVDGLQEVENAVTGEMQSRATGLGIGLSFAYQKVNYDDELTRYINSIMPTIKFLVNDGFITKIHEKNIGQGTGLELQENEIGIDPYKLENGFDSKILIKLQHFSTRLRCHMLRKRSEYDFIPLLGKPLSSNSDDNKNVVVSVVLDKLPIINPSLSWNELSQFKKEFDLDHLRLKNYINDLSKEDFKVSEVEEKVEYDLRELEKRYQLYDIDYDTGRLKVYIIMTAKFFEDVFQKKFVSAAQRLINFRETKIQLLKDELDIPNNDLSYIIKAEKKLT